MAETTGSMMNQHCGKNRHLKPSKFDRELLLEFNLGPQHMLEGLVEEVYYVMKKQFIYKKNSKGKLVSTVSKLADPSHGAANTCLLLKASSRQVSLSGRQNTPLPAERVLTKNYIQQYRDYQETRFPQLLFTPARIGL